MDTGEDLQGSNSQSWSTCPWFSPLGVGCQIIIRKVWARTIEGNVFGECHATCTLKTSILYFVKAHLGSLYALLIIPFSSLPIHSCFFSGSQTFLTRLTLLFPHLWPGWPFSDLISIYSFYILLNLLSSWIQLKYCSLDIKQQSINQSYDIILVFVFSPSYTRKCWVATSFHHKSGRLGP